MKRNIERLFRLPKNLSEYNYFFVLIPNFRFYFHPIVLQKNENVLSCAQCRVAAVPFILVLQCCVFQTVWNRQLCSKAQAFA